MSLKIAVRKESEVPRPTTSGRINQDLETLKERMAELPAGMVLEVEAGKGITVRAAKVLVTKAARALGSAKWKHWHSGNKVYAQPAVPRRRGRGRPRAK
jgi:hypothetical protein